MCSCIGRRPRRRTVHTKEQSWNGSHGQKVFFFLKKKKVASKTKKERTQIEKKVSDKVSSINRY